MDQLQKDCLKAANAVAKVIDEVKLPIIRKKIEVWDEEETGGVAASLATIDGGRVRLELWLDRLALRTATAYWIGLAKTVRGYELPVLVPTYEPARMVGSRDLLLRKKLTSLRDTLKADEFGIPIYEKYESAQFFGLYERTINGAAIKRIRKFLSEIRPDATVYKKNGANRPPDEAYVRYIKRTEIAISPEHAKLQAAFVKHLKRQHRFGQIRENIAYVDVRALSGRSSPAIFEIKPCKNGREARFAARHAVGQLLEYKYQLEKSTETKSVAPYVVLGSRPFPETLEFLRSLKIGCAWSTQGSNFDFSNRA